jgi:hypothetical protein
MAPSPSTYTWRARQALVLVLTAYGILCIATPGTYRLMDNLHLAIHEAGHLFLTPFGEFAHFLGGTLFQLAMPLAFCVYFWQRGDRFAAYLIGWWVAHSLWNVAVYAADARAQVLPLVGGGEHDWAYMLGRLGLLEQDAAIATAIRFTGIAVFAVAMVQAFWHSRPAPAPAAVDADAERALLEAAGSGARDPAS